MVSEVSGTRSTAKFLLYLLVGVLSSNAAAAAALEPTSFDETFKTDGVPISGRELRGYVAANPTEKFDPRALSLHFPEGVSGVACVRVRSQDSFYHANAAYHIPAGAAGWHSISFPTAHASDLGMYSVEEIGILLTIEASCIGEYTFDDALQAAKVGNGNEFILAVNVGAEVVNISLLGPNNSNLIDTCAAASSAHHRTAFNQICHLQLPEHSCELNDVRLEMNEIGGNPQTHKLQIFMPPGC